MVWDGNCGFCYFWIVRWNMLTEDRIQYQPYSNVADQFPDIDVKAFQQAVRFIETDGKIYSGAAAAFQSFQYGTRWKWLQPLYEKHPWFRKICDGMYDWIAKHRPFMHRLTTLMFGKNPESLRHYWVIYLIGLAVLVYIFS